jgi:hypothetical protein
MSIPAVQPVGRSPLRAAAEGGLSWGTPVATARAMNTSASLRCLTSLVVLSFVALGCGPSADEACTHYLSLRQAENLPANGDIHKECVKDVQSAQKKLPEAGAKLTGCIKGSTSVDEADACPTRSASGKERDKAAELWPEGIAAEASTAWVDKKVLDDDACNEGARAIARNKARVGIIRDGERKQHAKELVSACKSEMSNATYVNTFVCLRKADSEKALIACSTSRAMTP